MTSPKCPRFNNCGAMLCPMDEFLEHRSWYVDEEICTRRDFQNLDWIRKQKRIAKIKSVPNDKYFTAEMLQAIRHVRKGIEGINPDQPLEKSHLAERRWIDEKDGRVIAEQKVKPRRVVAKEKDNLVFVGKKTGGKKRRQK